MRLRIITLLAVVALLLLRAPASADYTYQFADSTGAATNSFSVGVGQTVDIRVYVLETGGGTTLQSFGLSSAGVQLSTQTPSIANVTNVTANAAFDAKSTTGTGANAFVSEFSSSSVNAPSSGADANRILLGTFTFTGLSAGQTLTVSALPGLNPDNVLNDGSNTSIDSALLNNTVTAIVTVAVPEPSTLALTGVLACGIAGAAVRRYRRRVAA
jgi:hypothetical protein